MAEPYAMYQGVLLAQERKLSNIIVIGDSKFLARGGKLEGKLSTHHRSQPHWNSAVWNFIWEGELQCRTNLGIFHCYSTRGITHDKFVSIDNTGSNIDKGSIRDNTRGNFFRGNIDRHTDLRSFHRCDLLKNCIK
jgi:hypothetical protein